MSDLVIELCRDDAGKWSRTAGRYDTSVNQVVFLNRCDEVSCLLTFGKESVFGLPDVVISKGGYRVLPVKDKKGKTRYQMADLPATRRDAAKDPPPTYPPG